MTASEAEIWRLQDVVASLTRIAVVSAQRHVADLAAARAITARLRAALADGATDAAQAEAITQATSIIEHESAGARYGGTVPNLARALLAVHEERKELAAQLAEVRRAARAIGMGPR